ncbi:MAG TPA: Smr/MutS family protein [Gammaproteobacteria bacterium]|nr:Smr/MutS family protein [Gammaproteobacteria bacterium]
MAKLKLDLHPIARNGAAIEAELNRVIDEAEAKRLKTVEIIHGKGSGQLKKRVLKFLERPDIKARYARVDKDAKNSGRLFVYFKDSS